jgi:hypothetical protein
MVADRDRGRESHHLRHAPLLFGAFVHGAGCVVEIEDGRPAQRVPELEQATIVRAPALLKESDSRE